MFYALQVMGQHPRETRKHIARKKREMYKQLLNSAHVHLIPPEPADSELEPFKGKALSS